jgi:hypothetical protein
MGVSRKGKIMSDVALLAEYISQTGEFFGKRYPVTNVVARSAAKRAALRPSLSTRTVILRADEPLTECCCVKRACACMYPTYQFSHTYGYRAQRFRCSFLSFHSDIHSYPRLHGPGARLPWFVCWSCGVNGLMTFMPASQRLRSERHSRSEKRPV